ncbi:MAG: hypothetical protein V4754_08490 [Pseudomonadota bacterium]
MGEPIFLSQGEHGALRPARRHRRSRTYLKPALALAFVLGAVVCGNAWAQHHGGHGHHGHHGHHRGHGHVGLAIGVPLFGYGFGPGWYDDPWYRYRYAAPVVVQPAAPTVYIERSVPGQWYFCSDPQGYYPYVKQCTTAWRTVDPQSVSR